MMLAFLALMSTHAEGLRFLAQHDTLTGLANRRQAEAALILRVPTRLLMSVIAALTVVGAYAINNSAFDVIVMAAMGLLAFFLRRGGFPLVQVVLGMVLGPILEQSFMTSAIKSRWDYLSFVERPIAIVLMLLTVAVIVVAVRGLPKRFRGDAPTE